MKRIVAGVVVLLIAVGTCHAYIQVKVDSAGGYVHFGEETPDWTLGKGVPAGSMFYVAWSSDLNIEPTALGSHLPSGDDKLCTVEGGGDAIFYTGDNGGSWAAYGKIENFDAIDIYAPDEMNDTTFEAGQVYLRVFNTNNPTTGDHYVSGSLNGTGSTNVWGTAWDNDNGTPKGDFALTPGPAVANDQEELDMTQSPDKEGGNFIVLDSTIQAIPEPGTLGLLALGLAGVFAARRRRK